MPKNIFNFTIKYLNNTLATRKNLIKWAISQSSACYFCLKTETLQHVVSSCTDYLEKGGYTWCHNSVLLFLAKTLSSLPNCSIYADLPLFLSPILETGDSLRPEIAFVTENSLLYVIELKAKYNSLTSDLTPVYSNITFFNHSMSALRTMDTSSDSLITMLDDLQFDKTKSNIIIKKLVNIAIRCTYYVLCCRNKSWTNTELLDT